MPSLSVALCDRCCDSTIILCARPERGGASQPKAQEDASLAPTKTVVDKQHVKELRLDGGTLLVKVSTTDSKTCFAIPIQIPLSPLALAPPLYVSTFHAIVVG